MIRELKYFKWVYDNQKITLVDKEKGKSMTLSMKMADSFVRAYISFKVKHNIEQKKLLRAALRVYKEANKEQVKNLKKLLREKK